jgi:CheY-like chemotaxis protein
LDRLHGGYGSVRRILVIDDHEAFSSLICRILADEGFQAAAAASGWDAIFLIKGRQLSDHPFDLIITDIQMPGFSGVELVEELRKEGVRVPVIAMSGSFESSTFERLSQHGCSIFLSKPFEKQGLLDAIDAAARGL